jgi:HK97 family phage prohead protease
MEKQYIYNTFEKQESAEDGKYIKINGWASTNSLDRHGDIINPQAWKGGTTGFDASPVLLYSHDHKDVIGRVTSYDIDDEKGLYIEAEVSRKWEKSYAVEDGLLKTFSVGFKPRGDNWFKYDEEKDVFEILSAELLEVSVVSVPANPTATFSVKSILENSNIKTNMKFFEKIKQIAVKHGFIGEDASEDQIIEAFEKINPDVQKSVDGINTSVEAIEQRSKEFEKQISTVLERLDVLEVEVEEKSEALTEANSTVEGLKSEISELTEKQTDLIEKYTNIKAGKKSGQPNDNDTPSVKEFKNKLGQIKLNAQIK